MNRPLLLDLFCGAGGAAEGYHRAGFNIVGVDINPQPHYQFEFYQADALEVLVSRSFWLSFRRRFDVIHASPPCQTFTAYRRRGGGVGDGYEDLIFETRLLLQRLGRPYVIENVPGAPLENPVQLCGSSFGLGVRRHRLFETNWPLLVHPCAHGLQRGDYPQATNRINRRRTAEIGVWRIPLEQQRSAMGIDWMTLEELSEAIPPAFSQFIGEQLLGFLRRDDGGRYDGSSPSRTLDTSACPGRKTDCRLSTDDLEGNVSYARSPRSAFEETDVCSPELNRGPNASG
jgi:DNA (cytosine-5)-methyltransferase 1